MEHRHICPFASPRCEHPPQNVPCALAPHWGQGALQQPDPAIVIQKAWVPWSVLHIRCKPLPLPRAWRFKGKEEDISKP